MKKHLITAGLLAASACSTQALAGHGFNSVYTVDLHALNNSGVSGQGVIAFSGGDTLRLILNATGLTPSQEHIMHIHGLSDAEANAICPNLSFDTEGDNLISRDEAITAYGPPQLSFSPSPTATADGSVNHSADVTLGSNGTPDLSALGNPQNRVVVMHGLTLAGNYDASLPVACGEIQLAVLQSPPEDIPTPTPSPAPSPVSGGGSSGSLGFWALGLLAPLAWKRRRAARRT